MVSDRLCITTPALKRVVIFSLLVIYTFELTERLPATSFSTWQGQIWPPYTGWFLFMHHLNTDGGGVSLSEVMDLLPAMIVLSLTQRSCSKTRSAPRFMFRIYDWGEAQTLVTLRHLKNDKDSTFHPRNDGVWWMIKSAVWLSRFFFPRFMPVLKLAVLSPSLGLLPLRVWCSKAVWDASRFSVKYTRLDFDVMSLSCRTWNRAVICFWQAWFAWFCALGSVHSSSTSSSGPLTHTVRDSSLLRRRAT